MAIQQHSKPNKVIEKSVENKKLWLDVTTLNILPGEEVSIQIEEEESVMPSNYLATVNENGKTYILLNPKKESSFKHEVISLEGPYGPNGKLVKYVKKNQEYSYYATLNTRPKKADLSQLNWALSYDDNESTFKLDFTGGKIENGKVKVKIQSEKAKKKFKVYAYTGNLVDKNIFIEATYAVEFGVEEIEILNLDEGSTNGGTNLALGMIYGKEYKLRVKKYINNKKLANIGDIK